ncbi:hypothetical protein ACWHAO_02270 [Streptomyces albidoflavus]
MKTAIRNSIVIGAAIAAPLTAATTATADTKNTAATVAGGDVSVMSVTSCPRDGDPGGGQRCTTIGNGVLTVRGSSTYITVNYYRKSGGSLTARNGMERNGSNTWASYRNMNNTPFHYTNSFSLSSSCKSVIGKLNTSAGDTYPTPAYPPC